MYLNFSPRVNENQFYFVTAMFANVLVCLFSWLDSIERIEQIKDEIKGEISSCVVWRVFGTNIVFR